VGIERTDPHNLGSNAIRIGTGDGIIDGLPLRDIVGEDLSRVRFIKIDIEGSEEPILRAILEALPDLPDDLIVASEVSPASQDHVARFAGAGFRVYSMQNVYTIDYYLIRSYLRRFGRAIPSIWCRSIITIMRVGTTSSSGLGPSRTLSGRSEAQRGCNAATLST